MQTRFSISTVVALVLLTLLALVPTASQVFQDPFLLTLFTRIVILALASVSLNFILGYGGLVSFGHAAFIGVGGYTVGIMAKHEVYAAWLQWPLALAMSAFVALIMGLLSLRTRGIFFIMITLALAQLVYYMGNGAYAYGGDDGLTILRRSDFAGLIDLKHRPSFYYLCWALLCLALYLCHRVVNSRFGMVLQGAKSNDRRMAAIGFPVFRYRLAAFVAAGTTCGLAGVLLANHTDFVSPALMHWTRSGDLIVMVVLGGMGSLFGPLFGALSFLALEEILSSYSEYWKLFFGPLLVLVVIFARGGIDGALQRGHGGILLAILGGFVLLHGIHLFYDDLWYIPASLIAAAIALAVLANRGLRRLS
ncbi:branched-chain amino acid ABC transporter permease [Ferrovibrio sp.]|uniref:branched-chain amino acid ABC transporter permease n=1 Tax=Ferrovibrio sp. TaxID=1917215 RepID=UPI003D2C251D